MLRLYAATTSLINIIKNGKKWTTTPRHSHSFEAESAEPAFLGRDQVATLVTNLPVTLQADVTAVEEPKGAGQVDFSSSTRRSISTFKHLKPFKKTYFRNIFNFSN